MKVRRKQDSIDEYRVFEDFGQFTSDRNFIAGQVALKVSSYDNKGKTMEVDTPCGRIRAEKGDVVVKYPNSVLTVMKPAMFDALYDVDGSANVGLDEAMMKRACVMVLDRLKEKKITNFLKAEQFIRRLAGEEQTQDDGGKEDTTEN